MYQAMKLSWLHRIHKIRRIFNTTVFFEVLFQSKRGRTGKRSEKEENNLHALSSLLSFAIVVN